MKYWAGVCSVSLIAISSPLLAGEEVLYQPAPGWVRDVEIDPLLEEEGGPSELLFDWQHRLEGGTVTSYRDRAVRIDNLEALTSEGTIQITWSPDKGDLAIHRFEILRGDEVIDLVADGVRFETLRREEGLEQRLLDGQLTATVAVPGLEEGDVLRIAHSTTIADQALGSEMQALQYLPPRPWRVGLGRTIVSWPVGEEVQYRAESDIALGEPIVRDGYKYLTVAFPIAKREEMPGDAPSRFSRAPVLRVGTYDDWQELSRLMEPHFAKAAMIEEGSSLERAVEKIMAAHRDPAKRTEMAVRLVQDQISYLLDGLDGGNYLPQSAEDTWSKRYGDCKAKSVLLMAILRKMGIEADVVLVTTRGGDALPELLPMPANFDHMIVRARVDGEDLWLDGTSTATRLSNMSAVPPFSYALPLRPEGADLVPLSDRPPSFADLSARVEFDHTAGVDLPALFTMTMELAGANGASLRSVVDENDPEVRKQIGRSLGSQAFGGGQVTSVDITYDNERAVGTVVVKGVAEPQFEFDQGNVTLDMAINTSDVSFAPNRVKPKWRSIPVATQGPSLTTMHFTLKLPGDSDAYTIVGVPELDASYANTRMVRTSGREGNTIWVEEKSISEFGEIPAEALGESRRNALQIAKAGLTLKAPKDAVWRWEVDAPALNARTAAIRNAYDTAVAIADDDDYSALSARADFFLSIYDFKAALNDLNAVIEHEPSGSLFLSRAAVFESLGRLDDAITDIQSAYDLDPANETAYYQAELLARAGKTGEGLALLDLLPVSEDEIDGLTGSRSTVLGLAGAVDTGLSELDKRLAEKSDNSELLNAACWYRALHKIGLDEAVGQCTRAVERADSPAGVLDSRAMVYFRKGQYDEALADLDAALRLAPGLSNSRYLRGIIMLEQGNAKGREEIAMALRISPELKDYYALYGISPAR